MSATPQEHRKNGSGKAPHTNTCKAPEAAHAAGGKHGESANTREAVFMVNHKTYLHTFQTSCVGCSAQFTAQGFVDVENGPSVHDSDAPMLCPACEDAAQDEVVAFKTSLLAAEMLIQRIDKAESDPRCSEAYRDRLYDKMSEWETNPIDHAAMSEALAQYEKSTGKKI